MSGFQLSVSGLYLPIPTPPTAESPDTLHAMIPRTVTLLDVVTGETSTHTSDNSEWWWWQGNGSCDCNRDAFFPEHEYDGPEGVCRMAVRYVVVHMDPMPSELTLDELNDSYPESAKQAAREWAAKDKCPKCLSTNVLVGNRVLSCEACGWHYLNKYPCRVCGGPATGSVGGNGRAWYSCKLHPFTPEEMQTVFDGLVAAIATT